MTYLEGIRDVLRKNRNQNAPLPNTAIYVVAGFVQLYSEFMYY